MRTLLVVLLALTLSCGGTPPPEAESEADPLADAGVFSRDNLVAWCIVPFDAAKRGPEERAAMLERLGLRALAYDYRDEHIPTFDAEIAALAAKNVKLTAWWCGNVDPDAPLSNSIRLALDALGRNKASADLWISMAEGPLEGLAHDEKVNRCAIAVKRIAEAAGKVGGRVGLYNHGGWWGEPENQMAVLREAAVRNAGIIYNFHHGHDHLDRLPELFPKMIPFLHCVNLNGMTPGGEKILPLGSGDWDLEMINLIRNSSYDGPIGILDHRNELDAEESLRQNLEGLARLVSAAP